MFDTAGEKILASRDRTGTYITTVGFDAMDNLVLADSRSIYRWRTPFAQNWELVYSLGGARVKNTR